MALSGEDQASKSGAWCFAISWTKKEKKEAEWMLWSDSITSQQIMSLLG